MFSHHWLSSFRSGSGLTWVRSRVRCRIRCRIRSRGSNSRSTSISNWWNFSGRLLRAKAWIYLAQVLPAPPPHCRPQHPHPGQDQTEQPGQEEDAPAERGEQQQSDGRQEDPHHHRQGAIYWAQGNIGATVVLSGLILLCILLSYVPLRVVTVLSVCGAFPGLYERLRWGKKREIFCKL